MWFPHPKLEYWRGGFYPLEMYLTIVHQFLYGWMLYLATLVFYLDVFKFDNSYSFFRAKEVFYSIKILPPDTAANTTGSVNDNSSLPSPETITVSWTPHGARDCHAPAARRVSLFIQKSLELFLFIFILKGLKQSEPVFSNLKWVTLIHFQWKNRKIVCFRVMFNHFNKVNAILIGTYAILIGAHSNNPKQAHQNKSHPSYNISSQNNGGTN